MLVYLRDRSAQTIARADTHRQKMQIKLSISYSHSILTQGQALTALSEHRQGPGRVDTEALISQSLV